MQVVKSEGLKVKSSRKEYSYFFVLNIIASLNVFCRFNRKEVKEINKAGFIRSSFLQKDSYLNILSVCKVLRKVIEQDCW